MRGCFPNKYLMENIQLKQKDLVDVRATLLESQGNICILCGRSAEVIGKTLCVDHSHKTGLVRAVLCRNCNSMAGRVENSINRAKQGISFEQWLDNFVEYIKADSTCMIHPAHGKKKRRKRKQ